MAINEANLKQALKEISERCCIKSFIFIYSEDDKFKVIGDISASTLAPILLKAFIKN